MCTTCGCGTLTTDETTIKVEQAILAENDKHAAHNREHFQRTQTIALNLVASPGAGKTTLLEKTLASLKQDYPLAVIEGDQQTSRDADRIAQHGIPVEQINTGKVCHLEAHAVHHALHHLPEQHHGFLFIENVGNLVCPALFDLGETYRVVLLSVTEGEDKPLKYPNIFQGADLMLVTKMDLLPYVDFDVNQCIAYAKQIEPKIQALTLSTTSGENFSSWLDWLKACQNPHAAPQHFLG